jgi:hypothetical protein
MSPLIQIQASENAYAGKLLFGWGLSFVFGLELAS